MARGLSPQEEPPGPSNPHCQQKGRGEETKAPEAGQPQDIPPAFIPSSPSLSRRSGCPALPCPAPAEQPVLGCFGGSLLPQLTSPPGFPRWPAGRAVAGCLWWCPARTPARSSSAAPLAAGPASPGSSPPAPGARSHRLLCPGAAEAARSRGAPGTPRPRAGLCPAGSEPAAPPCAGRSRAALPPVPASAGARTCVGRPELGSACSGVPLQPPQNSGCPQGGGGEQGRSPVPAVPLLQLQLLALPLLRAHIESPMDFLWGTRVSWEGDGLEVNRPGINWRVMVWR